MVRRQGEWFRRLVVQPGPVRTSAARPTVLPPGEQAMSVVDLDQGDRVVRLDAPDGEEAPRVTLLGEDGESVRAPSPDDADGIARRSDGTAVSDDDGSTFFVLPRGSEGTWSIKELAGSSPVQDMFVAGRAPDPDVSASVEGDGGDRTLRWTSAGNPYQTLLFSERLRSGKTVPILQTDAANGTTTFRPARGLRTYGERDLVVDVLGDTTLLAIASSPTSTPCRRHRSPRRSER